MKTKVSLMDIATGAGIALALGSAVLSMKMALADESVGTFDQGVALGQHNGGLIAERLYKRTIGEGGCAQLGDFQKSLNLVARKVKAPFGQNDQFVAGFFAGYMKAIRLSIKGARQECNVSQFDDGSIPGQFFASILCEVAEQAPAVVADLPFGPIYDGWSGGQSVQDSCVAAFTSVVSGCDVSGITAQLLGQVQAASCSAGVLN